MALINNQPETTQYLTIVITEACNLNCTYCYERHKNPRTGNFEIIRSFLNKELNNDDFFKKAYIDFFGGEPFLNFGLIKQIVEYCEQSTFRKKIHFFATTNGTFVHGHIKDWLISKKRYFTCGLSLDGDKKSQNINRSNSFDLIDLDFFSKEYPGQKIKMTVSEKTLCTLADDVIFCHSKGFKVSCNLAYGINWSIPGLPRLLSAELDKLITFYLEHPDIEPCSFFEGSIRVTRESEPYIHRWCGVTKETMKTLYTDGTIHDCQQLMPTTSGKTIKMPNIPDLIKKIDLPEKCAICPYAQLCPSCYASSYISYGNPYIKDKGTCLLTKIILNKRAKYLITKWERGLSSFSASEEKLFLQQYQQYVAAKEKDPDREEIS